jgi:hypothetical protein
MTAEVTPDGKGRCNTPGKKRFRDRVGAALAAQAGDRASNWEGEPYRCPAGHWHIRTTRKRSANPDGTS